MSWIKVESTTFAKPEVLNISSALGIDQNAVFGALIRIWDWFDQNTIDGNASGVTFVTLDRYVGIAGFCDAMSRAGWIRQEGHAIVIPNFEYHNGESTKKRELAARRAKKHRNKSNAQRVTFVTQQALPREDKRREDIKEKKHALGVDAVLALGVERKHAEDWLAVRKAKRAPLTQTALDSLVSEAQKARISVAEAVKIAAERGWQGFKSAWLNGYQRQMPAPAEPIMTSYE